MTKRSIFALCSTITIVLVLIGCAFGLMPDKSSTATNVSLRFAGIANPDGSASSRAIVQGGGYLYIRTVGGPVGDSGPFYGPYAVSSGSTFATDDIPAGTYSMIGLMYSASPLDESKTFTFNSGSYTFRQLMTLPDDQFEALVSGDDSGPEDESAGSSLEDFFGGQVSGGLVESVTVKKGETTEISVTLVPMTGMGYVFDLSATQTVQIPAQASMTRKFFMLENIAMPTGTTADLSCTVTPASGSTVTLGIVALYDGSGKLIVAHPAVGTVSEGKTYTATASSGGDFYLYIEYQSAAAVTLSFAGVEVPVTEVPGLTVTFAGGSGYASKKLFFGLYDTATMDPAQFMNGLSGVPSGLGLMTLDANGSGSAQAYEIGSTTPYIPVAGHVYIVSGMIDMDDTYSTISSAADVTADNIGLIMPGYGDVANEGYVFPATSISMTVAIDPVEMTLTEDYVYFVSNGGGGDGSKPSTPMFFADAIAQANLHTTSDSMIILMDAVTESATHTIQRPVSIVSAYSTGATLNLSGTPASSFFTLNAGSELRLDNVTVDGLAYTAGIFSAFSVSADASLTLWNGSEIKNVQPTTAASGAAIYVYGGGSLQIVNSSITNCSTPGNGGGIYLAYDSGASKGSSLFLSGTSVISGCLGYNGGGVFIGTASSIYIDPTFGTPSITGNTATSGGGGVYGDSGSVITDPGSIAASTVIVGNTAPTNPNIGSNVVVNTAVTMMFVTETGGGNGLSPMSPSTFANAMGTSSVSYIELMSDIPIPSPIGITRDLTFSSMDEGGYKIYPSANMSIAMLNIENGWTLTLASVKLGPDSPGSINAEALVEVQAGGNLIIASGAVLQNNASPTVYGGAVRVTGGQVAMNDGKIIGCSATAGSGGAIALLYDAGTSTPGTMALNGGIIGTTVPGEGNTAQSAGGGIFVDIYCTLNVYAGIIAGNTASLTDGGGICVQTDGVLNFMLENYSITGNHAGGEGGGLYSNVALGGSTMQIATLIAGNTSGGGVYPNYYPMP